MSNTMTTTQPPPAALETLAPADAPPTIPAPSSERPTCPDNLARERARDMVRHDSAERLEAAFSDALRQARDHDLRVLDAEWTR
jgi:hypothetical protein